MQRAWTKDVCLPPHGTLDQCKLVNRSRSCLYRRQANESRGSGFYDFRIPGSGTGQLGRISGSYKSVRKFEYTQCLYVFEAEQALYLVKHHKNPVVLKTCFFSNWDGSNIRCGPMILWFPLRGMCMPHVTRAHVQHLKSRILLFTRVPE